MDVSTLRDKAAAADEKGKHKKALSPYETLPEADAEDGMWPRKEGEMHRQLGNDASAIEAFERACAKYADAGFVVKAVAVCKMILRIDPQSSKAQEMLVAYNEARGISQPKAKPPVQASAPPPPPTKPPPVPVRAAPKPPPPPPAPKPGKPRSVESALNAIALASPTAATLESIDLHKAATGARHRLDGGVPSGIIEIPIELDDDDIEVAGDESQDEARDALLSTPLFEHLAPVSLRRLISQVDFVELSAGDTLFHMGDEGTTLFVVVEGRISILREEEQESTVLGELREGDFFGELGLVTRQPRSATARALVDCELLAISRQLLIEMIQEEASVLTILLRFLRERLVNNLVRTSPLFAPFVKEQRRELIKRFGFLEVEKGTDLVKQGESSPALFVALAGELSVNRAEDGETRVLAVLGSGDIFGEMSLLAQAEAVATVHADTKCLVLELPRDVFRETIMTHPHVLAFVGDLASDRERQLAAVAGGDEQYEELHLDLF